jgi:hypothetical protein
MAKNAWCFGWRIGEDVAPADIKIVGKPKEVKSYAKALEAEKKHIKSI